ncbi:hypothetical protein DV738_g4139, partial [Chaetothyriales sp. CBS 135597]
MPVPHSTPYRYPLTPPPSLPPIQPKTIQTTTVDISLLLQAKDSSAPANATVNSSPRSSISPVSVARSAASNRSSAAPPANYSTLSTGQSVPAKRSASAADLAPQYPAKKQSKWSSEEDARIIQLRGDGMKWEDISRHLPGRSAISCRLHYQNYLERRSEWDEDRKNKLAKLYERFKADMWSRIAEEMAMPWRAAEAMHWQMGETEMARRAGPGRTPSRGSTPRSAEPTPPPPSSLPSLPSLAELTAGLPAFSHSPVTTPSTSTSQYPPTLAVTPFHDIPGRRSLPPPTQRQRHGLDDQDTLSQPRRQSYYDRRQYP